MSQPTFSGNELEELKLWKRIHDQIRASGSKHVIWDDGFQRMIWLWDCIGESDPRGIGYQLRLNPRSLRVEIRQVQPRVRDWETRNFDIIRESFLKPIMSYLSDDRCC
jgi:hypothetical protein